MLSCTFVLMAMSISGYGQGAGTGGDVNFWVWGGGRAKGMNNISLGGGGEGEQLSSLPLEEGGRGPTGPPSTCEHMSEEVGTSDQLGTPPLTPVSGPMIGRGLHSVATTIKGRLSLS